MPRLLAIIELGGYPNLMPLYQSMGFDVDVANSQRKARTYLKTTIPDVIVAEYNFQSDFRDRSSNLESLMAVLQRLPAVRLIVFYPEQHAMRLAALADRFGIFASLALPLDTEQLRATLQHALVP